MNIHDIKKTPMMLEKMLIAELPEYWQLLTQQVSIHHPSNDFRHHAQYHGKVKKWLAPALFKFLAELGQIPSDLKKAREIAGCLPLKTLLSIPAQELAQESKAIFVFHTWGIDLGRARTLKPSELGLDRKDAKRANAVQEAVWRVLRFVRVFAAASKLPLMENKWPEGPDQYHYKSARALYNRIRIYALSHGIIDPAEMTSEQVNEAFVREGKTLRARDARKYRREMKNLKDAVEKGILTALTPQQLSLLTIPEIPWNKSPNHNIPEKELYQRWPEHFSPDTENTNKVIWTEGLPGFFNKTLTVPVPNPAGGICNPDNRLHGNPLKCRLSCVRRYLRLQMDKNPGLDFKEYFEPDRILRWLADKVEANNGEPTVYNKNEYDHLIMIARNYLGYDIKELIKRVAYSYQFPKDWESVRGDKAVREGSPQTLLDQADAFARLATSSKRPCDKSSREYDNPGSGVYLTRKSCELDVRLRLHTGFRPVCIDDLELCDKPNRQGASPCIWKDPNDCYLVFVPLRWLKQMLAQIHGKGRARAVTERNKHTEVPGIEIRIHSPVAVKALDNYISDGWSHAKAVMEGRTRRLFLNAHGEPFPDGGFGAAFRTCKVEAAHFIKRTEGRAIKYHTRQDHRSIIGTAVERHLPGHGLKTRYLTHSSDFSSDGFYGQAEMDLLSQVIDEIIEGKPTRPQQAQEKEAERDRQILELTSQIRKLTQESSSQPSL